MPLDSRLALRVLIGLAWFGAGSAAIGTFLAIAKDGGGIPTSYLAGTPFDSFLMPGLILGAIVGGTQLAAAVTLMRRSPSALLWSAVAAFGMLLWIYVELAMLQHYSWLQTVYFALGITELLLVLALLGIAPRVMHRWSHPADGSADHRGTESRRERIRR